MTAILLKNVPEALRQRLQERAKRNRRSMNQEALVILEQALPEPVNLGSLLDFKPIKLNRPIDVVAEIRRARDERGQHLYENWVAGRAPVAADKPVNGVKRGRKGKKA